MADGPKILRFPAPEPVEAREALQQAIEADPPLTNIIILSQRADGAIYHLESDSLTLADANWILDSYKFWLLNKAGGVE